MRKTETTEKNNVGALREWWTLFFGPRVEFRVKLLNAVLIVGLACCPPTVVANYTAAGGGGVAAAVMPLIMMVLCLATLWYVTKTGRHLVGYLMVVVALAAANIALFFIGGGYNHASQILNFMFGILLAAIMLRGKLMVVFCVLQFILYTACIVIEYRFPETVTVPYMTETDKVFDIMVSLFTLSAMLTVVLGLFFRLYDRQALALESALGKVEELSKMQNDIFARMSHEMRTPLSTMSIYAQLAVKRLSGMAVDGEVLSDLAAVSGEAERLSEMADSVLKTLRSSNSRDATHDNMSMEPVDVCELAGKVCGIVRHALVTGNRRLDLDTEGTEGVIIGDAGMLMQLFWNLLANAVAHSCADNISVRLFDDGDMLAITVEDDGKGIAPDLLPRIFDAGVSGAGSSGIGLHLCREIARRHGGEITAEPLEKGTRFVVRLRRDE